MLLFKTLALCRELYNASLEERKEAYKVSKVNITYNQQASKLPGMKKIRPEYKDIYSQALQDILRRCHPEYCVKMERKQANSDMRQIRPVHVI